MTTISVGYTKPTPASIDVGSATPKTPSISKGLVTVVGPPGPPGPQGEQGIQGDPGVVVSPTPPADHDLIWVVDT